MVHFGGGLPEKKYSPYAIALPNNMTCWHFPKKSSLLPSETLHLALIVAKNGTTMSDIYVNAELEKGLLDAPAKHKRRIAGKIAALKRKLREKKISAG